MDLELMDKFKRAYLMEEEMASVLIQLCKSNPSIFKTLEKGQKIFRILTRIENDTLFHKQMIEKVLDIKDSDDNKPEVKPIADVKEFTGRLRQLYASDKNAFDIYNDIRKEVVDGTLKNNLAKMIKEENIHAKLSKKMLTWLE